jgi:alkylhydroperoxidase family enzyme
MGDDARSLLEAMSRTVFDGPGHAPAAQRRAVGGRGGEVPRALTGLVEKIRKSAYKVTDEDVAAARAAGFSEEQLFELTIATALGTALDRRQLALEAAFGESKKENH